jgi:hypothetical protein
MLFAECFGSDRLGWGTSTLCPKEGIMQSEKKKNGGIHMTPAAMAAALAGDLPNAIAATTPGGIEAQESRAQQSLINNAELPKECDNWAALEAAGVKRLGDADDLFVNVQLPPGWRKQATDHSMWSDLLDEKGSKRAAIFYKGAFYDRRAFMRVEG